eukprot:CAMPEP_0183344768 /NCGR_PEP_ID=MMETSP0164_2-20130417/10365_1 /TAXON_ID=221442 /ORGANISM="Coccolithus pelagicus ssp braarudi, Strain PLY182g" /LENGTH=380 /DNA_ID=CAMNT_0025515823 /DNA_START=162 /DNA_END=1304 /DNA_ORIENTATION=+
MNHYGIGSRGAVPLSVSLSANTYIAKVNLSDNGLNSAGVSTLLTAIRGSAAPSLTELDVSHNQAGLEGAKALAQMLLDDCSGERNVTGLQRIDFGCNQIGDLGAKQVSEALGRCGCRTDALTSLSLTRNEISADGANALAAALATNSALQDFCLSWNSIADAAGAAGFAQLLSSPHVLRTLDLSWNGLSDAGVASLAQAIRGLSPGEGIKHLSLDHNRLTAKAAAAFAPLVSRLEAFSVSGNPIGQDGAAALLVAHHSCGASCQLSADEMGVRPDSAVGVLLAKASMGEPLTADDKLPDDLVQRAEKALAETGISIGSAKPSAATTTARGRAKSASGTKATKGDMAAKKTGAKVVANKSTSNTAPDGYGASDWVRQTHKG